MVLHKVPSKQLGDEVMIEAEDVALLGSGSSTIGQIPISSGGAALSFGDLQDGSTGAASAGTVLEADGVGGAAFVPTIASDLYVRTVAGTGGDFDDLAAALTDFDGNAAKVAVLLIEGVVPAGLSETSTITKPVRLLGTTTDAAIDLQTNLITVDPTATNAQPTLEVENLKVSRVAGGTGGILFNDDAIIRIRDCLIDDNATSAPGTAMFETAAAKKLTLFADRTTFESSSNGLLFKSGATGGLGLEVHLSACRALRSALSGDLFTCAGGATADIFVRNRTLLDRVDINIATANLEIIYQDNRSLVLNDSDIISGSTTVRGEAGVDLEMATAISLFSGIQIVLDKWVGDAILIQAGTYVFETGIFLGSRANARVRGVGPATILKQDDLNLGLTVSSSAGLLLENLTLDSAAGVSGTFLNITTSAGFILRNVIVKNTSGNNSTMISSTATDVIIEGVKVLRTGGDIQDDGIIVTGVRSIVRDCIVDIGASGSETTNGINAGNETTVENCQVRGKFLIGINAAGSVKVIVQDNFVDQTDLTPAIAGAICIDVTNSTDALIKGNRIKAVNTIGIKAEHPNTGNLRPTIRGNFIEGGLANSVGIQVKTLFNGLAEISDNNIWNSSGIASMAIGIKLTVDAITSDQREHIFVRNNTIQKMITIGIQALIGPVSAGANTQRGPSICDNNIVFVSTGGATFGIFVDGDTNGDSNNTEGTKIDNNFIHMGTDATPGDGISASNLDDSSISDNHIIAKASGAGTAVGIDLVNVDNSKISNNQIKGFLGASGVAIVEPGTCDNNLYVGNHVTGNTTGLSFSGTNRLSIGNKT